MWAGLSHSIDAVVENDLASSELEAYAIAVSASVNNRPPWQTPRPLTMSGRTVIVAVACPGRSTSIVIPNAWEAASSTYMLGSLFIVKH